MPGANTPLTEREKAALFAYSYGLLPDMKTAYICADNNTIQYAAGLKALKTNVSKWANSPKVKSFLEYCTRIIADKEYQAVQRGADEERRRNETGRAVCDSVRTEDETPKRIAKKDYYNPEEQRKTINAIIDKAQDDPKTQLDAIKAIQQTQRDDRQAAKDNQIQRYYTPIACKSCPFKAKAAKKG